MWQAITMGITFGFVSSFHCIGMCGPLVLALPVQTLPPAKRRAAIFLYHIGRIATYTMLGIIFGIVGRHIFMAGFQRVLSISAGVLILAVLAGGKIFAARVNTFGWFFNVLQKNIQRLWQKASIGNFILLGSLNGLLPCGMVYFALASALSFGSITGSMLFMAGFGSGTLVLMLALHYFGSGYISLTVRNKMRRAVPIVLIFTGVLLIFRGLNLGIPYLSPNIGGGHTGVISCH
ncbi:MAG TPA: sulfite exporter TauE/SafE family protein [Chitinophagaceae bacterium]|nr:sulfite exporter TauE/SafE family protein [Chitinophagaceae bacterium]